ncbi:hypothetical protein [Nocardioides campestrisoli]|nr:hypothetical protein [Nocardioides campestrisoli]
MQKKMLRLTAIALVAGFLGLGATAAPAQARDTSWGYSIGR